MAGIKIYICNFMTDLYSSMFSKSSITDRVKENFPMRMDFHISERVTYHHPSFTSTYRDHVLLKVSS